DDRFCLFRDLLFDQCRINVEREWIRIDQDGGRSNGGNGESRCDEGVRRKDDFISYPDFHRSKGEHKSVEAVRDSDRVLRVAVARKIVFESRELFAADVVAIFEGFRKS